MNQIERESQLSAMFDGELPAAECELLSRRLARDEQLRGRWSHYALIGAAMRSEPVAAVSRDFAWRVSAALDTDAGTQPVRAATPSTRRVWRSMAAGGVLAAGVAGVAVFMLRNSLQVQEEALVAFVPSLQHLEFAETVIAPVPGAEASNEPASYVVPPVSVGSELALPAALANYVVAHSEYSSPLVRRNLISALVGSETAESLPPVDASRAAPSADAGQ